MMPEVPRTFEECQQAWFVTSDPVHTKDEMLFGWNAAVEACAQVIEKREVEHKNYYDDPDPDRAMREVVAAIREKSVKP